MGSWILSILLIACLCQQIPLFRGWRSWVCHTDLPRSRLSSWTTHYPPWPEAWQHHCLFHKHSKNNWLWQRSDVQPPRVASAGAPCWHIRIHGWVYLWSYLAGLDTVGLDGKEVKQPLPIKVDGSPGHSTDVLLDPIWSVVRNINDCAVIMLFFFCSSRNGEGRPHWFSSWCLGCRSAHIHYVSNWRPICF